MGAISRSGWLWVVPLAFYVSMYGAGMMLFATIGTENADQALLMWLVMAPAGALAALLMFVPVYLIARIFAPPKVAATVGLPVAFALAVLAAGASLTLLGGPV